MFIYVPVEHSGFENTFSRDEFKKGAVDCMTALMIVVRALMVVQGCYCMPRHV